MYVDRDRLYSDFVLLKNTGEIMRSSINIDNISYERIRSSIEVGIFDKLHIGVALIAEDLDIIYCNDSFARMYDLPDNATGQRIDNFILPSRKDMVDSLKQPRVVACLSQPQTDVYCIFMSYPVYDSRQLHRGAFIEVLPMASGKEAVAELMDSMRTVEMKTYAPDKKPREKGKIRDLYTFDSIIGNSPQMRTMICMGRKIARSNEPVLIYGESGTGKELVAQAIHMASPRASSSFVCVNCAALPADLMESELFGYESGSFTGARASGMKGKFEEANNGTIFLDEIGEMPLAVQAKLLRVLESGEIQKIGHKGRLSSNFRLVAATNKNLLDMVRHGQFREDLYHRLNVFELPIPPLRERGDDLYLLIKHFMETSIGVERALKVKLEDSLVAALRSYSWPGNVRELKNIMTHALFLMDDSEMTLGIHLLPPRFQRTMHPTHTYTTVQQPVPGTVSETQLPHTQPPRPQEERQVLQEALIRCQYNKVRVTKELGISRSKLYRDLRKHGLLSSTMDSSSR